MYKRLFFLLVLAVTALLVACGGGDEADSSEPVSSDAAQDAAAGSDADTGERGSAESAAADAKPATSTPVPEPEPTPTLAPTPTEMAEAPAEEEVSTASDGSVASGAGWGEAGTDAQTACDHPYLPLRPGATWTYAGGEDTLVWEVLDVQGDLDEASAVLNITVGDVSLDYAWDCVAGEGLNSFDFASLGAAQEGVALTIEQTSIDGQFLLPPEQLVLDATWTTNLESTIAFTQEAEGISIDVTGDMTTEQQNTVIGANPVEFNGQTVEGLQIEQVNNMTMLLSLMGNAMEQAMSLTNNYNLGYGIGMVSQYTVSDFGTETVELVSFSIP